MKILPYLFLILINSWLYSQTAYLSDEYTKYGINKQTVEKWEDGTRTNNGEKNNYEWWYFDFKFDDGTLMVIDFLTKPINNICTRAKPFYFVDITFADGTKYQKAWKYKHQNTIFSEDSCFVKMGKSYISGNLKQYKIHIEEKDIEINLTITNTSESWRPKTGYLIFDSTKYFAWLVAVPEATTKANIKINNKKYNFTGKAYHDHNWGNYPMHKLMHHWHWSRTQFKNYSIIAASIVATKKYNYKNFTLLAVFKNGKLLIENTDSTEFFLSEPKPTRLKKVLSDKLLFRTKNNDTTYILQLNKKQITSVVRLVYSTIKFKPLAYIIEKLWGLSPVYYRISGQAVFNIHRPKKSFITLKTQNSIWEVMYFNNVAE